MDNTMKIVIGIVLVLIIVFIFYFLYSGADVDTTQKIISYKNKELLRGTNPIFTSDYKNKILYSNKQGIFMFDTKTKETKKIESLKAKGLAYDLGTNKFIILDEFGKLYNLENDKLNNLTSGYSNLYDTNNGYYLESGENFSFVGGKSIKKINGIFGDIKLNIR